MGMSTHPAILWGQLLWTIDLGPKSVRTMGVSVTESQFFVKSEGLIALWTFLRSGSPNDKLQGLRVREC